MKQLIEAVEEDLRFKRERLADASHRRAAFEESLIKATAQVLELEEEIKRMELDLAYVSSLPADVALHWKGLEEAVPA